MHSAFIEISDLGLPMYCSTTVCNVKPRSFINHLKLAQFCESRDMGVDHTAHKTVGLSIFVAQFISEV